MVKLKQKPLQKLNISFTLPYVLSSMFFEFTINFVCTYQLGETIEDIATENHYSVVPVFTGHGIGSNFHEPPDVYHFCKLSFINLTFWHY